MILKKNLLFQMILLKLIKIKAVKILAQCSINLNQNLKKSK